MPADYEVAIVGAGAAGLAAARALMDVGARFVLLEASGRTGGRAFTETTRFGQAWDLGCHWLHAADTNPFVPIADALGFRYRTTSTRLVRNLWLEGGWAAPEVANAAADAVDAAFDAVRAAGETGPDEPAQAVLDRAPAGQWADLVRHWFCLMTASPPPGISTRDFAAYRDTEFNWPVIDGYGALVRAHHAHVPVELDCPVTHIDWSGGGVRLATPRGEVRARTVIIAVPTAVLAQGRITFAPHLPVSLAEAFDALRLGVAEKVAIGFDRDVFGYDERTGVTVCRSGAATVNFQILPGERPVAIGHVAGPVAGALLEDGAGALADAVRSALTAAFGNDIAERVADVRATNWAGDPLIGGAYSCAVPGLAHLRARLLDTLGDRLLFAGEAARLHDFSTCHGAHLSGIDAAGRALRLARAAA